MSGTQKTERKEKSSFSFCFRHLDPAHTPAVDRGYGRRIIIIKITAQLGNKKPS
jgi:hypothetical protein